MSDNEGSKKTGYRVEYAPSARAKCKGPKPCAGTPIAKGELRFGTLVDFKGNTTFAWRHWGCVTPKIISNMKATMEDLEEELDGFDELTDEDKEKVRRAWEEGHVADEDIPDSARKPKAGEEEDEEEEAEKPKKKAAAGKGAKKADDENAKGVFKLEYAASGRSKCKEGCGETIGKGYLRVGHEVDFRGNKSFSWQHWGCISPKLITKMKNSYSDPSEIEGFDELKEEDKEKVRRAWEEGEIPEDDKAPGEPVELEKKKPAARKSKKDDDEERPKKRARKAKKEEEDEDEEEEEEEEKPKKKRAPAKKPAEKKEKAPAKKRAPKKKQESEESGEDFGDDIAAVEEEEEEEADAGKKRKRAPASKAGSSSKPSSKARTAKPSSSRGRKQQQPIEEDSEDE